MIAADTPITHERALLDLRAILYSAQHARSVMAENGWADDAAGNRVLEDCQPWLWGPLCIVLPLSQLIERCEKTGKVQPIDYLNFLIIAERTPALTAAVLMLHHRELPAPDMRPIMAALGDAYD